MSLTIGSLFAGIGGFDLAARWVGGFETRWFVEIDPYCQRVLKKHWPNVPCYNDVREVGASNLEAVDILCGGFPCQPVSLTGKRKAQADDRWLWPEYARILRDLRPRYVVVENVPGLLSAGLDDVLSDLAASGYDAEWSLLSSEAVGAPHERSRLFLVAYPDAQHGGSGLGPLVDGTRAIPPVGDSRRSLFWLQTPLRAADLDDGLPAWLYAGGASALGNAIVPQCAVPIFQAIKEAEAMRLRGAA